MIDWLARFESNPQPIWASPENGNIQKQKKKEKNKNKNKKTKTKKTNMASFSSFFIFFLDFFHIKNLQDSIQDRKSITGIFEFNDRIIVLLNNSS